MNWQNLMNLFSSLLARLTAWQNQRLAELDARYRKAASDNATLAAQVKELRQHNQQLANEADMLMDERAAALRRAVAAEQRAADLEAKRNEDAQTIARLSDADALRVRL